ncbi:MAG: hypothetical protein HQM10_13320 [Candidatus Riflebacteria bacterium]|nr:hypothetical protein [Candidatus Riflebacteria bacterium]
MGKRKIDEIFERGVHYFRGSFFSAALIEFLHVERLDPKYPNIAYFVEVTRKKYRETGGQLSSFIEENFDSEARSLSEEIVFEGSVDLTSQVERLLKAERVNEALEKIDSASLYVPDSKPLILLKAKVLRCLGRFNEAEKQLFHAKQLFPDDPAVLNALGNIFLLRNMFVSAGEYFSAALDLLPEDRQIQNNIAVLKMQSYKLDEAQAFLKKIVYRWPSWQVAARNLSAVETRIGYLDDILDKLRSEAALHPEYLDISVSLGKSLLFRGYFSESKRTFLKAIDKNPSLWEGWFYMGVLHEMEGELNDAIKAYQNLAEGKKRRESKEYKAFQTLFEQGYVEEALLELKKVAVLEFDPAARHISLGIKYFEDAHWTEALRHFTEATEISPYPDAYYWCGLSQVQLEKRMSAKKSFEKAIELHPRFADAHFQLGMLLKKKTPGKARHHLQVALTIGIRPHFQSLARDFLEENNNTDNN